MGSSYRIQAKEATGVSCRFCSNPVRRLPSQPRELFDYQGELARVCGLIGGVGLDEQAVEGDDLRGLSELPRPSADAGRE